MRIGLSVAILAIGLLLQTTTTKAEIRLEFIPDSTRFDGPTDEIHYDNEVFRCRVKDHVQVRGDGTLTHERLPNLAYWSDLTEFEFDSGNGKFRWSGEAEEWQVLRQASSYKPLIANRPRVDPLFYQLRITTYWQPFVFWLTDATTVHSGTCSLAE